MSAQYWKGQNMEKNSRKFQTLGFTTVDAEMDIITRLDRNQMVFQARMLEIFQKYDRPFVNSIVVNIEDFTYMTPEGRRRPWTFEGNILEDGGSEEKIGEELLSETEDSVVDTKSMLPKKMPSIRKSQHLSPKKKSCDLPIPDNSQLSKNKLSTTFEVEPFHGQTLTASMEYNANDHKKMSPRNGDLNIMRKTVHIALPVNTTVYEQMKRFIEQNNKECFLKSSGRYTICQADDDGPSDREEASYSEPGNRTLGDYYPQMIENLSNLWDFQVKNQKADDIVRYYKRLGMRKKVLGMKMINRNLSKSFNRSYTICPAPNSEDLATAPKTHGSTPLQNPRLSLFSELHKYDSPAAAVTPYVDSMNNASKPFQCILDSQTIYKDRPLSSQQQKIMNGAISPGYSSRASSPSCKMCISPSKGITNKSHMDIVIAQSPHCKVSKHFHQKIHSLSRRNSFSGFPILQSPKQVITKPNCNMSKESKSPSKFMTIDSQREVDRRDCARYEDHIKQLPERTSTLTRRNSFSAFSAGHSKNRDFESLYKNLTHNGPHSIGNSPGSLRAKRLLIHDSLVSPSKKPRSVIDSSNSSSHSMDRSDPLGLEPSSSRTRQHSAAASPLPPYMLPNSPGSHRSFSPRVTGGSPKTTNARVHRKLIY